MCMQLSASKNKIPYSCLFIIWSKQYLILIYIFQFLDYFNDLKHMLVFRKHFRTIFILWKTTDLVLLLGYPKFPNGIQLLQQQANTFSKATEDVESIQTVSTGTFSALSNTSRQIQCCLTQGFQGLINVVQAWLTGGKRLMLQVFFLLCSALKRQKYVGYFWLFKLHSPSSTPLSQTFSPWYTLLSFDFGFNPSPEIQLSQIYIDYCLLSWTSFLSCGELTFWRFRHWWVETVHVIASITVVTEQKLILEEIRWQKHLGPPPRQPRS